MGRYEDLQIDDAEGVEAMFRGLPMLVLSDVVLFPHALIPLHLEQEAHLELAREVVAASKLLAVGLELPGAVPDAEGQPAVHRVAGVGEVVMAHELADGRFNLVVRGRARIRIQRELPSRHSYRMVSAIELPDEPTRDQGELLEADQTLRALVHQLADSIPDGGQLLRDVMAAQETPVQLVNVLSAALVVDLGTRQGLLETTDVLRRMEQVSAEVAAMIARVLPSAEFN